MRIASVLIILCLAAVPVLALTTEVSPVTTAEAKGPNFWQEFDITFWQTAPFALFWGYVIGLQISQGGAVNWEPIVNCAFVVSLANAYFHARRATVKRL